MNDSWLPALLVTIAAYLAGSIPCGQLLTRGMLGVDLRKSGSGNIGATNAARAGGPALGLATLAADMLKAWVPVWAAARLVDIPAAPAAAALAAVLGHAYPLYTRFRGGGKGVATTAGGFLHLAPGAVLLSTAVFLMFVGISRRASVGSLTAALVLPFAVYLTTGAWPVAAAAALASAIIFIRHAANIRQLIAGTEPAFRFGRRR
jgi:glycerol-3-phosphate acyltransferase PlsY